MNVYMFDFLMRYYKNKSIVLNINKNTFAIDNIENLLKSGRIDEKEGKELLINVNKTIEYVIKVLSDCPYMNININNNINIYNDNSNEYF